MAKTVTAKPALVQISTAYKTQREGSPVLPRNKYTAIRDDKPKSNDEAKRPEFKVCKFTTDAIVTEGSEIGTIHKVCANPACPIHHPKKANGANDAQFKAEREKRRREETIANATGLRILSAIGAAVPVRLMKRDLLFVAERLANLLDENRCAILAKQHGIKKTKENESVRLPAAAFAALPRFYALLSEVCGASSPAPDLLLPKSSPTVRPVRMVEILRHRLVHVAAACPNAKR